jgi:hypothetical protein
MITGREVTIRTIQALFFQMEEEENLFAQRMSDGTYYWDVIRRDIYLSLHTMCGGAFARAEIPPAPSLRSRIKDSVKPLLNKLCRRYLIARAPKYIFVTGQRIRKGSILFDNISDHLYDLLAEDAVAIEIMNKSAISYQSILLGRKTRIPPVASRTLRTGTDSSALAKHVTNAIFKHFGMMLDVEHLIAASTSAHRETREHYRKLFLEHRPNVILCINNGTLSGMFAAAKEAGIPTIELQHGASCYHTIFWSYPKAITASHPGLSLPTAYFTYSDYWRRNTHFPVHLSRSIGTDYFSQQPVADVGRNVLMISSYMYREALLSLSIELADRDKEREIFFKLHPHEFDQAPAVRALCAGHDNIRIVCDAPGFLELFASCKYVVGVHSTTMYTALQAGKRVCLLRQSNYFWHEDIFDYVELFDNATELHDMTRDGNGSYFRNRGSVPEFFRPFDEPAFLRSLNDVQNYMSTIHQEPPVRAAERQLHHVP